MAANSESATKAAIKAVHTIRLKGEAAHDKHLYALVTCNACAKLINTVCMHKIGFQACMAQQLIDG